MKIYSYFLILFFLDTSICLPSAQTSQHLLAPLSFSWSCSTMHGIITPHTTNAEYSTFKELPPDDNFGQIAIIKKIIATAIQRQNKTIITIASDNNPDLRLFRIQLTDVQKRTTMLIRYRLYCDSNHAGFTQDSIWSLIAPQRTNNIGVTSRTAGEIAEIIVDTPPDFKERLSSILNCKATDRLVFYPLELERKIAQEVKKDNRALSRYPHLDPRALANIQRYASQGSTDQLKT